MIEQIKDIYEWHVTYTDGSVISEYDREEGRGFAEVGNKPVKAMVIKPLVLGKFPELPVLEKLAEHCVLIPEGATPVFFRRRSLSVEVHMVDEQDHFRSTVHCIGWKREGKAVYLFVFDDGSTLLTNDLQAV